MLIEYTYTYILYYDDETKYCWYEDEIIVLK